MRLPTLLSLLAAAGTALTSDAPTTTAAIYLQPLTSPSTPPTLLAKLALPSPPSPDSDSDSPPEILSYEAPDTETDDTLLRIGLYNPRTSTPSRPIPRFNCLGKLPGENPRPTIPPKIKNITANPPSPETQTWLSSTTALSSATFAKGYAPHFALSLDSRGRVLGVACRGVAIDAGQTRDFGPQASVVWSERGEQPVVGRPVVLSAEGKKVEEEGEKSLLQRYVLFFFAVVVWWGGLVGGCADAEGRVGTGGCWLLGRFCCLREGGRGSDRFGGLGGNWSLFSPSLGW